MKTGRIIFLYSCLTLALAGVVDAQEWRQIVPLKSTRADVERLLGPGERSNGVVYELKDGNLSIEYSTGPCSTIKRGGWNVPEGVVISFRFSPKVKQRISDLKPDRKRFKKVKDQHVGVIYYYINDKEGIMYEVQQGEVGYVEYYPPQAYDYLQCGNDSIKGKSKAPASY